MHKLSEKLFQNFLRYCNQNHFVVQGTIWIIFFDDLLTSRLSIIIFGNLALLFSCTNEPIGYKIILDHSSIPQELFLIQKHITRPFYSQLQKLSLDDKKKIIESPNKAIFLTGAIFQPFFLVSDCEQMHGVLKFQPPSSARGRYIVLPSIVRERNHQANTERVKRTVAWSRRNL